MSNKPTAVEKLAPDTSVLIEGIVSEKIGKGELVAGSVLIHEAVVAELEHQANLNKAIGYLGLDELERLQQLSEQKGFRLEYAGAKPRQAEIAHARMGEIDSMIRDLAYEQGATLLTADKIQAKVARVKSIPVILLRFEPKEKTLKLEEFFDSATMSVHLREGVPPFSKKGMPGNWEFTQVRDEALTREEIQDISREIIEEAGMRKDGFIEIERPGSTIVQLGRYRIVITKPPFSDGWEITAVRPVRKMGLSDYQISEKLMQRISQQAEGILIAGAPGHGKSTFAQALAEYYAGQKKIVKTIEAPRDLILPDAITQYAISHGDAQEIHDILLLSRPDYTVFDEMRNTADFKLFADLRLAGIGLAGVVHATNPIDAIQRFVGRIELGVIPQVIDTVIFIRNGFIGKVLSLKMTVKVPEGMTEADLARPVVVVNDFETKKLEYELYSYGEETVVIPVRGGERSPSKELAARAIEHELRRYVDKVKVELVSDQKCIAYVPAQDIARIIGKQGKTIEQIEKAIGIGIDVQELDKAPKAAEGEPIAFDVKISKKHVILQADRLYANRDVMVHVDGDYLLTAKTGMDGVLKISRNNKIGKILTNALNANEKVTVMAV